MSSLGPYQWPSPHLSSTATISHQSPLAFWIPLTSSLRPEKEQPDFESTFWVGWPTWANCPSVHWPCILLEFLGWWIWGDSHAIKMMFQKWDEHLYKRSPRKLSCSFCTTWGYREGSAICNEKAFLPHPSHTAYLTSDSQPPEWWDVNVSHLVLWHLLYQPKLR